MLSTMKANIFLYIYSIICTPTQLERMKRQESNKWTLLSLPAQKKKMKESRLNIFYFPLNDDKHSIN